jgi:hypothetical protein
VIAYLPQGQPVTIHLDKLSGSRVKAQWYDPRTGTWKAVVQFPNQGIREFVPPSQGEKNDWALVLDAVP